MANFPTHIAIGTLVSGTLATLTLAVDAVAPQNLVAVTLAGVLGSVLPDIDLKESRPARALFSGLAVFFAFAVLFSVAGHYSVAEMLILYVGTLLAVRYGAKWVFFKMSYHRGIWHSILAGAFVSFVTAVVYYYVLGRPDAVCWLAAGFMFIGYMTHLALDEIYSVDVMDTRIKASFGTAIKLVDRKHWGHTSAMAAATVVAFMLTPSASLFVKNISSQSMWASLERQLLPPRGQSWFGINLQEMTRRAGLRGQVAPDTATTQPVSGITTGSVTPAQPPVQAPATEAAKPVQ
jgi:membrane-bound metal-dependent hydrolase YbcI (DUF457 family)